MNGEINLPHAPMPQHTLNEIFSIAQQTSQQMILVVTRRCFSCFLRIRHTSLPSHFSCLPFSIVVKRIISVNTGTRKVPGPGSAGDPRGHPARLCRSFLDLDAEMFPQLLFAQVGNDDGARSLLLDRPATFNELCPQGCSKHSAQMGTALGPVRAGESEAPSFPP